jgi:hypothetical protein
MQWWLLIAYVWYLEGDPYSCSDLMVVPPLLRLTTIVAVEEVVELFSQSSFSQGDENE